MRRVLTLIVLAILCAAPMGISSAEEAKGAKTLAGDFDWNGRDKGALEAVFTPTGEGTWEVAFHFDFRGAHVYSGKAEGSLSSGELKGKVQNEGKERTFTFTGSFKEGKFKGTHAEIKDGKEQPTGSMTLGG